MAINITCGRRTFAEGCYDPIPGSGLTVADTSTKQTYSFAAPGVGCKIRVVAYTAAVKIAVGPSADADAANQAIYLPVNFPEYFEYQPGDVVSFINA